MDVSALIQQLNAVASSPSTLSETDRSELLAASQKLASTLEDPLDATIRTCFSPVFGTAVRLGIDTKLFDAVVAIEENGKPGASVEQLAAKTGVEPLLVLRIARTLAATGVLKETAKDAFGSTTLSKAYVSTSPFAQALVHFTNQSTTVIKLPEYFEKHGYKNPGDAFDGPFQFAFDTKQHVFEWLAAHPRYQQAFNVVMTLARRNTKTKWFEYFPVEEKLDVASTDVALVDIGGGVGHDLVALKSAYPQLKGRLVLEDLPVVVSSAKDLPAGIEALGQDMFTPQPVKSAKAYFLHHVLHDWPDRQASIVLSHIRDAMDSESLLLISESPMPEEKALVYNVAADLMMMAAFSALERTELQFKELLEGCGFSLVKIWRSEGSEAGNEVLFEAKKKE